MSKDKLYVRPLEDGSGFGVFFGGSRPEGLKGGYDRWEECLSVGKTEEEDLASGKEKVKK
jgi:hypothetical protein